MKIKTLAIPIRVVDFSETSQVVALYTRERGLLEGIAKGAYRPRGSFQGPFDLGVLYEVVFLERSTGGLSILTESTVVDGFRGLREVWARQMAACHIVEFLRVVAVAGAPDPAFFDLLRDTLGELAHAAPEWILARVARFDVRALRLLGLLGSLDRCVQCGREWPGGKRPVFLSPRAGGVVCRGCRATSSPAGVVLSAEAVRLLLALTGDEDVPEGVEKGWSEEGRRLARVIGDLRNHLLERELVCLDQWCRLES